MKGEIKVVLTLDDKDFSVKTVRAGEKVSELRKSVDTATGSMRKFEDRIGLVDTKFRDIIYSIALVRYAFSDLHDIVLALPRAFLEAGGEFEKMRKLMEGMSKETDDTKRRLEALSNVQYVIDLSIRSPFDIKTIQDGFVKFKSVGLDPTNGSLRALVDSVARFGGTSEQFKRASVAIQQMAGKGVISMEELRQQLGEAVPDAMQMMAEGTGLSMGKLVKIISSGQLEATRALDQMFTIMAVRNRWAAENMAESWVGATQQMKTQIELFKANAAELGGDASFMKRTEAALAEVLALMKTPEMKSFARDLSIGLGKIVDSLVSIAKAFGEVAEYIKLAGMALIAYFGVRKFQEILSNMDAIRARAQMVVAEGLPKGKGGFYQSYIEGAIEARNKVTDLALAQQRANNDKIKLNNEMIESNREAITDMLNADRKAHAERIALAQRTKDRAIEAEQQLAGKVAELEKQKLESLRLAKEMRDYENRAYAQAYSGNAGNAGNLERLAQMREAQRERVRLIREEVEALKVKTAQDKANAIEQLNAANNANRYSQATRQGIADIIANTAALKAANGELAKHAADTAKATMATQAFRAVLGGMGAVFTAMGGWVTVAIMAITVLGEKLYNFITRWDRANEIIKAIKEGVATEKGNKEIEDRLAEAKRGFDANLNVVASQQEKVNRLQKRFDEERNQQLKAKLGRELEFERSMLTTLTAARAEREAKIAELEKQLADGRRQVRDEDGKREATQARRDIKLVEESQIKALREADQNLKDERERITNEMRARVGTDKVTQEQLDKATKPIDDQIRANLIKMTDARLAIWKKYRDDYRDALARTTDEVQRANKLALQKMAQAEYDELLNTRRGLDRVGTAGLVNADDKSFRDKVDPLTKLLNDAEAKLAEARARSRQIINGTSEIAAEQEAAALDLFKRMANGEFNFKEGAGKDTKEQKFQTQGQRYLDDLRKKLSEGSVDVLDYIKNIKDLDVVITGTADTVKNKLLAALDAIAKEKAAKDAIKAMEAGAQLATAAMAELTAVQEQNNASMRGLPQSYVETFRAFEKLKKDLQEGSDEWKKWASDRDKALDAKLRTDLTNRQIQANAKLADEQLKGIVISSDREYAAHLQAMRLIQEELDAVKNAQGASAEAKEAAERLATTRRITEMERFRNASKSQLDRMLDDWRDTARGIDGAITSMTRGWMDQFDKFLVTGKFRLEELTLQFARDLAGVQIRATLAPMMESVGKSIGDFLGVDLGGTQGPKFDAATGAQLVKVVNNKEGQAADIVDLIKDNKNKESNGLARMYESGKKEMDGLWSSIKDKFGDFSEWLKNDFGSMVKDFGAGFWDVIKMLGNGIADVIATLWASASANSGGDIFASIASVFGFANGGVMSGSGPLSLNKYANGGIATKPQLALFGEGSMNEAFVPLPDGRSIPVTMSGAMSAPAANVTVNVINQTGQQVQATQKGGPRFDGRQMILDVVLSAAAQPGPFRDSMKNMMS